MRNSFGLAFDPLTGSLWDTENGPDAYDEIDLVTEGFNSGWDAIMGPEARDAQAAPEDLVMLSGARYSDPEFSFERPIGITAIEFLAGSSLPGSYEDAVLIGNGRFTNGNLYLLRLNAARDGFELEGTLADGVADGDEASALVFGTAFGIVTDIQVGPDGAVYVASLTEDAVFRIAPVPLPAPVILLGSALALLGLYRRRLGASGATA